MSEKIVQEDPFITITKDVLDRYYYQIKEIQDTTTKAVKPIVIGCMQTAMQDMKTLAIQKARQDVLNEIQVEVIRMAMKSETDDGVSDVTISSQKMWDYLQKLKEKRDNV